MTPISSVDRLNLSHSARSRGLSSDPTAVWMLVGIGTTQATNQLTLVQPIPFTIGRKAGCALQLNSRAVSSQHAVFELHESQLVLKDCASTNGTYVNGQRITGPTTVRDSDLIQFADVAFRIRKNEQAVSSHTVAEDVCDQALSLVQFDRMMENRLVTPYFQPIVKINTTEVIGFEVLARSRLFGLESANAMFDAATRLNMEVELSEMLRWEGIREGLTIPTPTCLYVNTHPREIEGSNLLESVARLRTLSIDLPMVLEIHESAITVPQRMRELSQQLRDLNIRVAYDDFGAGQNRLAELAESPPDIIKFDMSLIRDIDTAPPERQRMVASFVRIAVELGIETLAEGIETVGEATVCAEMGFVHAQGFFYGRPAPPRNFQDKV